MHNHQCVTKGSNQKNTMLSDTKMNEMLKRKKKSEILCDYSANERRRSLLYQMMAAAYRLDMIFACFHEIHKRIEEKKNKLKEFPKQFNIQRATQSHDSRANVIVSISILMITCLLSKAT